MTRIVFTEVALKAKKTWKDPATGRQRQVTKKFWQTLNQFNRNADGSIKTREQILVELRADRDEWLRQPPTAPSAS